MVQVLIWLKLNKPISEDVVKRSFILMILSVMGSKSTPTLNGEIAKTANSLEWLIDIFFGIPLKTY